MNNDDVYERVRLIGREDDQPPQSRRNHAVIKNLMAANDDNRTAGGVRTQSTSLEQTLLDPTNFSKGEQYRGRQGSLDPDIGQSLHFQRPFGLQPQEAMRWNTMVATERAPPKPVGQGLGLLHSQWADRPQAPAQPSAHRNDLRLDGPAQPDINTDTNNLLFRHFDRPNLADPRSRDPMGKDNTYGVPWHRLN